MKTFQIINASFEILKGHNGMVQADFCALLCRFCLPAVVASEIAYIRYHKPDAKRPVYQRKKLMEFFAFLIAILWG
jgi:hypothetical protein